MAATEPTTILSIPARWSGRAKRRMRSGAGIQKVTSYHGFDLSGGEGRIFRGEAGADEAAAHLIGVFHQFGFFQEGHLPPALELDGVDWFKVGK